MILNASDDNSAALSVCQNQLAQYEKEMRLLLRTLEGVERAIDKMKSKIEVGEEILKCL